MDLFSMQRSIRQVAIGLALACISAPLVLSQEKTDSLINRLNSLENDREKLQISYVLVRESFHQDTAQFLKYCDLSFELAEKLNDKIMEARLYLIYGYYYSDRDIIKALDYLNRSYQIVSRTDSMKVLSMVYSALGSVYFNAGNYSKSYEYYLSGLKVDEKYGFRNNLAGDYNNIAIIYSMQKNERRALEYYFKALELNRKTGQQKWCCVNMMNISISYGELDSTDLQMKYALEAYECARNIDDELLLADVLSNLGEAMTGTGDLEKVPEYYDTAEKIYNKHGAVINLLYLYLARGNYYREKKDFTKAIDHYEQTLEAAKNEHIQDLVVQSASELSGVYKSLNDYRNAFHYFEIYHQASDSVSNVEKTTRITELELQYNFDKQLEIKRIEEEERQRVMDLQRTIIIVFVSALILALCLVAGVVWALRTIKRNNKLLEAKNTRIQEQNDAIARSSEVLREQRDQLKLLNATKDKMYSIIAHDLKNPFNVLLGFTTLLSEQWDRVDDAEKKKFIEELKNTASGAYELLQNLLDWARSQSGNMILYPECIEIRRSIDKALLSMYNDAGSKNITVLNNIDPELRLMCDINMFNSVIRNLVSNAIKFTPEKGTVTISGEKTEDRVSVTVRDTGVGISEGDIKNLFNIETHFSTSGTRNERGTGLGLMICKELVEKNGGIINIKSKPGEGSSFIISLPSC